MEVDTGIIVRSCGRVMYNVIASDGRLLRRHINQIRRRAVARAPEGHQLPLDVLLEEWSSSSSRPEPTQPELEPIVSEVLPYFYLLIVLYICFVKIKFKSITT